MLQSRTVVAALYVGPIGKDQLVWATQDSVTNLMNPRALPRGEPRWTCRVWVKTVLAKAQAQNYIKLPASLGKFVAKKPKLYLQSDRKATDARNSRQY